MEEILDNWIENGAGDMSYLTRAIVVCAIIIVAMIINYIGIHLLVPAINKLTRKTKARWDDILLSERVVKAFCNIVPPIVLTFALPFALSGEFEEIIMRCCSAYIIIIVVRFCCIFVSAIYELFYSRQHVKARSLKGISQTIQIIICIFGVILVVSTLLNKSPLILLTGLGAMATILMLIFQDSIKGLVAGIQLSANDMMRPGDWITMAKCGADGVVTDVSLNTVKVRNWDNTITTIPPYLLVSDSFQNWRGMSESNGRRISRALNIDMHSIRFCTEAELTRYKAAGYLPEAARAGEATNLQAFRNYMQRYLQQNPAINTQMTLMVRQLAPGPEGLPLQIYCFSRTKVWEEYESIQAALIEYLAASLPAFGLYIYQRTAGTDTLFLPK